MPRRLWYARCEYHYKNGIRCASFANELIMGHAYCGMHGADLEEEIK